MSGPWVLQMRIARSAGKAQHKRRRNIGAATYEADQGIDDTAV
jgi:hypothetical protein